jgi:Holliday junction DNA helicase RuvB
VIERIIGPAEDAEEGQIEETLRPRTFASYVGQPNLKANLELAITAAKARIEPIEHVLLYGPPGLGKTTMAGVIASETGASFKVTSGPAIERAGDLASLLTNMAEGDILFIDEIHRLPKTVEEVLYPAMEDFGIDIMLGKGPSAKSVRLDLPKFTIIGATTKIGEIAAPLRDRFGLVHRLEFYSPEEMGEIIRRSAKILGIELTSEAGQMLATRSRLTPRIANRLLKRVRDYAQVHADGRVTPELADKALKLLEIDELGLDASDRRLLKAIIEHYNGGPVGVETLAALVAEERATIEDVHEPYLMQIGFIERTPRGRKVTPKAHAHLGLIPPTLL